MVSKCRQKEKVHTCYRHEEIPQVLIQEQIAATEAKVLTKWVRMPLLMSTFGQEFYVDLEDESTVPMPYTTIALRERRRNVLYHPENITEFSYADIGRFVDGIQDIEDDLISRFMLTLRVQHYTTHVQQMSIETLTIESLDSQCVVAFRSLRSHCIPWLKV